LACHRRHAGRAHLAAAIPHPHPCSMNVPPVPAHPSSPHKPRQAHLGPLRRTCRIAWHQNERNPQRCARDRTGRSPGGS
jgi:hypothetical protein